MITWTRTTALLLALMWSTASPPFVEAQHTVRAGQSLSRIARRHHVDVWDLAMANRMRPADTLRPGQTLVVPPQGVTYVRPGQTLSHVAADHSCSVEELTRLNRLRGRPLRVGQRLVLPGFAGADDGDDEARDWGPPRERGVARFRRRDQVRRVALLDAQGRVTIDALEQLADLMRAQEDDPPELPHPRLAVVLAAISDHFGGREIALVSGRREAGGYTRETSRHTLGQATDVRVEGVSRRALWEFCRSLSHTGCGFYPRSTFVHVDVRAQAAQWVDWSAPGERPRYGNLREPWPRMCQSRRRRNHRRCAREGRDAQRAEAIPLEPELTDEARARMPVAAPLDTTPEPDPLEEPETLEAGSEPAADGDDDLDA